MATILPMHFHRLSLIILMLATIAALAAAEPAPPADGPALELQVEMVVDGDRIGLVDRSDDPPTVTWVTIAVKSEPLKVEHEALVQKQGLRLGIPASLMELAGPLDAKHLLDEFDDLSATRMRAVAQISQAEKDQLNRMLDLNRVRSELQAMTEMLHTDASLDFAKVVELQKELVQAVKDSSSAADQAYQKAIDTKTNLDRELIGARLFLMRSFIIEKEQKASPIP